MQKPFTILELPPLLFKRFPTTMHYSVISQIILTFINVSQILKINLVIYLKCLLNIISYFKKFKNLKCNYDITEDLMNINEADQTYSLISRTDKDNLICFSSHSFSQQRAIIFIMKNNLNI